MLIPTSWVEWHAALTHFPIALIIVAVGFDIGALVFHRPALRPVSLALLSVAVVSLPFALFSGYMTGREFRFPPVGFQGHWIAAVITFGLTALLLFWRVRNRDRIESRPQIAALLLTVACAATVGYTGHTGGQMVFGGRSTVEPAVAAAPTPPDAKGAEKIGQAADKMQAAAGKLDVATNRLASSAKPPVPTTVPAAASPSAAAPAAAPSNPSGESLANAAEKMERVAAQFEATANKLERIAREIQSAPSSASRVAAAPPAPVAAKPPVNGAKVPVTTPPAATGPDPQLVAVGARLFMDEEMGCLDCHKVNGQGGRSGPDLTHAAQLHSDLDWQIAHLKDPAKLTPGSKMPAYDTLPPDELKAIASYLISLK